MAKNPKEALSALNLKKILVVNLAGMGDLIMASPALKALRHKYPEFYIGIFILSENKDLLNHCPYVNNIFILKRKLSLRAIFGNLQTLLKLRKLKFDIAINLYQLYSFLGALKIWFLFLLINPSRSLGRDTEHKGFFYTFKIDDYFNTKRHQVEGMLEVVKFLGADSSEKKLEVWFSAESENHLKLFLNKYEILDSDIVVGINPGSRRPSRRWPGENFAKVANELITSKAVKVVLTGSKEEKELAEEIAKLMKFPAIVTCGDFGIEDLMAFIKRCNIFITNDTGPMHIANALNKPLVVLRGGGSPATYPYHQQNCIIIKKDVPCYPCYKYECEELDCLKKISPAEVIKAVESFL